MAGAVAGCVNVALGYPFAFIITRLEADPGTSKRNREFRGMYDCFKKIYKIEGFQAFFRGMTVSLMGQFIYKGLYFGIYDTGLAIMLMNGFMPSIAN